MNKSNWREWASLYTPIDDIHLRNLRRYMQWRRAYVNRLLRKIKETVGESEQRRRL